MKFKITRYEIQSDHMLATPQETNDFEIVEADSIDDPKLVEYCESRKDWYGNSMKKEESFGFQYISNAGALTVEAYVEPTVKKLS